MGTNLKINVSSTSQEFKENEGCLKRDFICQIKVPKCLATLCSSQKTAPPETLKEYVEEGLLEHLQSSLKELDCKFRESIQQGVGEEVPESRAKSVFIRRADGAELLQINTCLIVDYLIELANVFFYKVLETLLATERTRLGADKFSRYIEVRNLVLICI